MRFACGLVLAAMLCAGHPDKSWAQQLPPRLETATAQRLLAQVTAALDSTPSLTLQPKLIEYLASARNNWGMPPTNLWPYLLRRASVQEQVRTHLARGEIYSALVKADSLAEPHLVTRFLYVLPDSSPATLRSYVDQVHRFLAERPGVREHSELAAQAARMRAHYDFAVMLADTDTIRDAQRRTTRKVELAAVALRQRRAVADSLLISTRDDVHRYIRDERQRAGLLEILWNFCRFAESKYCDSIGVTPTPETPVDYKAFGLYSAIASENWPAVQVAVDSLKKYLTMPQVGVILLRSAQFARTECTARERTCGPEVDRAMSFWLNQTEEWIRTAASSALQDTLRTQTAVLLAGRDTRRAFQLLNASRDTLMNQMAYGEIARLLLLLEPHNAWYAFERSGTWGNAWAAEFAMQFRTRGDSANERRALARMDPLTRMNFEIGWARHLMNNGQQLRARNHALDALEWWDPAKQTLLPWPGYFDLFQQLGIYPQLIRWAERRPSVTARTAALLAVVGVR